MIDFAHTDSISKPGKLELTIFKDQFLHVWGLQDQGLDFYKN